MRAHAHPDAQLNASRAQARSPCRNGVLSKGRKSALGLVSPSCWTGVSVLFAAASGCPPQRRLGPAAISDPCAILTRVPHASPSSHLHPHPDLDSGRLIDLSPENIVRWRHAFFPPSEEVIEYRVQLRRISNQLGGPAVLILLSHSLHCLWFSNPGVARVRGRGFCTLCRMVAAGRWACWPSERWVGVCGCNVCWRRARAADKRLRQEICQGKASGNSSCNARVQLWIGRVSSRSVLVSAEGSSLLLWGTAV